MPGPPAPLPREDGPYSQEGLAGARAVGLGGAKSKTTLLDSSVTGSCGKNKQGREVRHGQNPVLGKRGHASGVGEYIGVD